MLCLSSLVVIFTGRFTVLCHGLGRCAVPRRLGEPDVVVVERKEVISLSPVSAQRNPSEVRKRYNTKENRRDIQLARTCEGPPGDRRCGDGAISTTTRTTLRRRSSAAQARRGRDTSSGRKAVRLRSGEKKDGTRVCEKRRGEVVVVGSSDGVTSLRIWSRVRRRNR